MQRAVDSEESAALTYSISQRTKKLLAATVSSFAASGKLWNVESITPRIYLLHYSGLFQGRRQQWDSNREIPCARATV